MSLTRYEESIVCTERLLTSGDFGHCLNTTQCFSPDGSKIVYDIRNDDSRLASCTQIRMVDVNTGEDSLLYENGNASEYGPGVGAATFAPDGKRVLFLGGIQNASKENPYSFTRRTGISIELDRPGIPVWMDARDIRPPFTPGALRGGTHAHAWSHDGEMISFTYNDHILAMQAQTNADVHDTRTVGIMFPKTVIVKDADNVENKNGNWYSVLVTDVKKNPVPGSDEISRAFDECWIGVEGYNRPDGSRQEKAIAFQGHVVDESGDIKTSVFVVDIPTDIRENALTASPGTMTSLPSIPDGVTQRRVTGSERYVSPTPRHWLRTTPDGSLIGFLSADDSGIIQLWGVSPNGGTPKQLTFLSSSITSPFNFSPDGNYVAFTTAHGVCITRLQDNKCFIVAKAKANDLVGAVNWSPTGDMLAYNRYVESENGRFLQIFLSNVDLASLM